MFRGGGKDEKACGKGRHAGRGVLKTAASRTYIYIYIYIIHMSMRILQIKRPYSQHIFL